MRYVYVIENDKGQHYIGSCQDLVLRLKRHNQNSVRSTKHKGPYRLIYKEELVTSAEARKREMQLKACKGNSVFRRLIRKSKSPSSSLV